jgi:hypothetical protein
MSSGLSGNNMLHALDLQIGTARSIMDVDKGPRLRRTIKFRRNSVKTLFFYDLISPRSSVRHAIDRRYLVIGISV